MNALPSTSENVRIHVHPEDAEWVRDIAARFEAESSVVEDDAILPGGCKLQTRHSLVDFTVEKRFQKAVQSMLDQQLGQQDAADEERAWQAKQLQRASPGIIGGIAGPVGRMGEFAMQAGGDAASGAVVAERAKMLGAIRLSAGPDKQADAEEIAAALVEGLREHGLALLPWGEGAAALRDRAAFAGESALSDESLLARLDEWLPPLVAGRKRLDRVEPQALTHAMEALLGWDALQAVNRIAPRAFTSPAGSTHSIDYAAEGGPRVELRVQALFGLAEHPVIGRDRVPLVLSLTSPAGRPIQTTRDLPGFWAGSWRDVAKEMRGRYPRHPWPDDPASAAATLRTKKTDARRSESR